MSPQSGVSLQISLAPTDLAHASHILPHQLRQWASQVDEVLLVLDLHQSAGRFSDGWREQLAGLRHLMDECCAEYAHARTLDVDYSPGAARNVASTFFAGQPVPAKDWNGSAFYSYFFGLYAAQHDYVFHMDSDMMYGGGSSTWVAEAVQLLRERRDVLICSPLPGPPTLDGQVRSQTLRPEPHTSRAFRSERFSTRVFLLDRGRFHTRIGPLPLTQPLRYRVWQARAEGNPPYDFPETILSRAIRTRGLVRIEFLGSPPGMWSLHPPHRSALFYARLPRLIEKIEAGEVPDAQRGDHDVNDSMIDWTSARKSSPRRLGDHLALMLRNAARRMGLESYGAGEGRGTLAAPGGAPRRL
jgi:hypothetical protein